MAKDLVWIEKNDHKCNDVVPKFKHLEINWHNDCHALTQSKKDMFFKNLCHHCQNNFLFEKIIHVHYCNTIH
jgi:hypothetical protein